MPTFAQEEQIELRPGDEITNPRLIELLKKQPVLELAQLLKLSEFYQAYPTNVPVGQHLALVGLAMQGGPEVVQAAFRNFNLFEEGAEFFADGGKHKDANNEERESFQILVRQLPINGFVLQLPVNGFALLVETFESINEGQIESERHFIIGVSPV